MEGISTDCTEKIKKILEKSGHTNVRSLYMPGEESGDSTCCNPGRFIVSSDELKTQEVGSTLGEATIRIGKLIGKL